MSDARCPRCHVLFSVCHPVDVAYPKEVAAAPRTPAMSTPGHMQGYEDHLGTKLLPREAFRNARAGESVYANGSSDVVNEKDPWAYSPSRSPSVSPKDGWKEHHSPGWRSVASDESNWSNFGDKPRQICRYYAKTGRCGYGDSCKFQHEAPGALREEKFGRNYGGWKPRKYASWEQIDSNGVRKKRCECGELHVYAHKWCGACGAMFKNLPSAFVADSPYANAGSWNTMTPDSVYSQSQGQSPSPFVGGSSTPPIPSGNPFRNLNRNLAGEFNAASTYVNSNRVRGNEILVEGKWITPDQDDVNEFLLHLEQKVRILNPDFEDLSVEDQAILSEVQSYYDHTKVIENKLDWMASVLMKHQLSVAKQAAIAKQKLQELSRKHRQPETPQGHSASTAVHALRQLAETSPALVKPVIENAIKMIQTNKSPKSPIEESDSDMSITGDENPGKSSNVAQATDRVTPDEVRVPSSSDGKSRGRSKTRVKRPRISGKRRVHESVEVGTSRAVYEIASEDHGPAMLECEIESAVRLSRAQRRRFDQLVDEKRYSEARDVLKRHLNVRGRKREESKRRSRS